MKDLDSKLTAIDSYFSEKDTISSEKERFYQRVMKLTEEIGELNEAVLYENDVSHRDKDKHIDLDEELADVIICTLLLAKTRNVDIWNIIDQKLEKQFERFNLK